MGVNNEMELLNRLYMELGKAYYEGRFEEPLPELLPLFDKITQVKNNAMRPNNGMQQNQVVRPNNRCPHCGYELEEDAAFCGNCGKRIR